VFESFTGMLREILNNGHFVTMHESHEEYSRVAGPSNRSFGLTVGSILVLFAAARWFFSGGIEITAVLFAVGLGLVAAALLRPSLLTTLNRAWMRLGYLLARVVNPVIMFVVYALVFAPIGLVMRLNGRDALNLKAAPGTRSYWIDRRPPGPPPESLPNQF
jgi:hypothetical protein